MRALAAAVLAIAISSAAPAQDDPLPDSVARPYLAYERAVQAGDAEGALAASRQAWEAAREERLSRNVLALLTENYAYQVALSGDYETASGLWQDSARQADRDRLADIDRAWRWHNAARNAFLAGDTSDASQYSRRATDALNRLEDAGTEAGEFAPEAYYLSARVALRRADFRRARRAAETALALYRAGNREPDLAYALMHYAAGIGYFVEEDRLDAAYHFHMSDDITEELEGQERMNYQVSALETYSLSLADEEHEAIAGRLAADPLHAERYSSEEDEDASAAAAGDGFVDVTPLVRQEPRYPYSAARSGIQGVVAVSFAIDETGAVDAPEILVAIPEGAFEAVVLEAMEAWRYEPATRDGEPVRREGVITHFSFMLAR